MYVCNKMRQMAVARRGRGHGGARPRGGAATGGASRAGESVGGTGGGGRHQELEARAILGRQGLSAVFDTKALQETKRRVLPMLPTGLCRGLQRQVPLIPMVPRAAPAEARAVHPQLAGHRAALQDAR